MGVNKYMGVKVTRSLAQKRVRPNILQSIRTNKILLGNQSIFSSANVIN